MARNECPHVFDPEVALEHADDEVAQLPANANDQADRKAVPFLKMWEGGSNNQGKSREIARPPAAPSQVFFGLMLLRSGCRPNNLPKA